MGIFVLPVDGEAVPPKASSTTPTPPVIAPYTTPVCIVFPAANLADWKAVLPSGAKKTEYAFTDRN